MKARLFLSLFLIATTVFAGKISSFSDLSMKGQEIVPYKQVTYFFEADFAKHEPVWNAKEDRNYENRCVITFGAEKYGRKCLLVTHVVPGQTCDTAWEVVSLKQEYKGKPGKFVMDLDVCSDISFANMRLDEGYGTQVKWFDAAGKSLGVQKVKLDSMNGMYFTCRGEGDIPQGAAAFILTIGFDTPNVNPDKFFAISKVRLGRVLDGEPIVKNYWVTSMPMRVEKSNDVSWEADVPEGASLKFQISEAADVDGEPGFWSAFHGPTGGAASYYTEPFKTTLPWVKLKWTYSSDGKAQAVLKSITINGETDSKWYRKEKAWGPVVENLTVSPTHNRREPIVLNIICEDAILWSSFKAELDGKDVTAAFNRDGNKFTVLPQEDFSDGLHKINVSIGSINGIVTESRKYLFLGDSPAVDKITLRDDGITLVNGKPFFPIGPYAVWKREFNEFSFEKAFAGLKEGGFNFAHTYNGGADMKTFLDTAHKYGFKLWIHAQDDFGGDVMTVKLNHPAILAWYIGDDTSYYTTPAKLQDRHDALKAIDDNRITTQADGVGASKPISNYADFVRGTDNFLPEIYPVRQETPEDRANCVPSVIRDMKKVMKNIDDSGLNHPKSVWPIIQYFDGWGAWRRFPEENEIRAMSYVSIIHGGTGITWYTYGGYMDKANNRYNHGITSTPERWRIITTIAKELNSLIPVLVERKPADQPLVTVISGPAKDAMDFPSISCLMKRHDGETYILAVNSSVEEVKA
ncbi:MAG: hypothetical protein J6X55_06790, partial [Victivallales bacterium]|nr:hypothetical protein [Victivallales bacterium]